MVLHWHQIGCTAYSCNWTKKRSGWLIDPFCIYHHPENFGFGNKFGPKTYRSVNTQQIQLCTQSMDRKLVIYPSLQNFLIAHSFRISALGVSCHVMALIDFVIIQVWKSSVPIWDPLTSCMSEFSACHNFIISFWSCQRLSHSNPGNTATQKERVRTKEALGKVCRSNSRMQEACLTWRDEARCWRKMTRCEIPKIRASRGVGKLGRAVDTFSPGLQWNL